MLRSCSASGSLNAELVAKSDYLEMKRIAQNAINEATRLWEELQKIRGEVPLRAEMLASFNRFSSSSKSKHHQHKSKNIKDLFKVKKHGFFSAQTMETSVSLARSSESDDAENYAYENGGAPHMNHNFPYVKANVLVTIDYEHSKFSVEPARVSSDAQLPHAKIPTVIPEHIDKTVPVRESVSESVILPLDYYIRHERNNSIRPESPSRSRESQPIPHELSMSRRSRMTVRDLQHLALRTSASPDMENKTMPRSTLNESEQKVCKVGQDSTSVVSAPTNLKSSKLQLRSLDDERKKSSEKRLINRIEIGHRNELDIRVTPMQKSLQLEDLRKLFTKLAQTRMHWEKNDHVLECHVI
eukprot:jgi/Bigna1/144419/aug1.87_g19127